ncbi:mitochondrial coenzyme A diphosphatase NUDT8 isoform X3 [Petaurus breviceps papuanus]|uniref:mitochondrial coenzyme A diphosphatase NUDT8 isoform X3 n=1 Tax=Petaurus breviceps papuanus TaxID=3040969 RepID=UPI0036DDC6EA
MSQGLQGAMLPTLRLASRQHGPWGGNGPLNPEEAARHALSSANELRCRQLLEATTARYRHREASAAVLVPLCSVHGEASLLYTLRSSRLIGKHRGDVSFPGGKCDPQDQDIVDTALRETREELGLPVQEENVWGIMKPVNDQRNSIVVPVIAQVGPLESLDLTPSPQEIFPFHGENGDQKADFRKTRKDLHELMLSEVSRARGMLYTVTAALCEDGL